MVKLRVETPSVNYMLFDESSKKLAKQKGKVSEVESKVKSKVRNINEAKQRNKYEK